MQCQSVGSTCLWGSAERYVPPGIACPIYVLSKYSIRPYTAGEGKGSSVTKIVIEEEYMSCVSIHFD